MELLRFLKTMPVSDRRLFALRCGTSLGHVNNVAYGQKICRERLAINIERESGGLVRCETTCPGVDWAYIRGTAKRIPNVQELAGLE